MFAKVTKSQENLLVKSVRKISPVSRQTVKTFGGFTSYHNLQFPPLQFKGVEKIHILNLTFFPEYQKIPFTEKSESFPVKFMENKGIMQQKGHFA